MNLWPFGRRREELPNKKELSIVAEPEPSAMGRLLSKNCNRDEFVLLYLKMLQERLPDCKMQMTGESTVQIVSADGRECTAFMDNAWVTYSGDEENPREVLERYARIAAEVFERSPPLSRDSLVAMIKDATYISMFKQTDEAVMEHLCGDLWVAYAEDLPDRMRSLKRESLREALIDEGELRSLAKENLRRILPETQRHGDGPWYMLTAGGDYTASLLLFDGLWEDFKESVEGDVVAVVPSRDVLLYTGSQSRKGLAAIRERAANILATGNYLISETLIVRKGGRWEVFKAN